MLFQWKKGSWGQISNTAQWRIYIENFWTSLAHFLHFHVLVRKIWPNNRLALSPTPTPFGGWRLLGNPGSATVGMCKKAQGSKIWYSRFAGDIFNNSEAIFVSLRTFLLKSHGILLFSGIIGLCKYLQTPKPNSGIETPSFSLTVEAMFSATLAIIRFIWTLKYKKNFTFFFRKKKFTFFFLLCKTPKNVIENCTALRNAMEMR